MNLTGSAMPKLPRPLQLIPVLSRLRWWNNMESSLEGQPAVTALACLAGGDTGNRLALLRAGAVVCIMRALSL